VLRSYSLQHECGEELLTLLRAYRDAVNQILEELWDNIEWEKRKVKGKKQWRLKPKYTVNVHSGEYRRELRDRLLQEWPYAAHWVDSAIKTPTPHSNPGGKTMLKEKERGGGPPLKGFLQESSRRSSS